MLDPTTLKDALTDPPYITADLPGIGGRLKEVPEDFVVEEVLPYEACGEGEHIFVKLQRTGANTADVARTIARAMGINGNAVSWAGTKDKWAVVTQTFSFAQPLAVPLGEITARLEELPCPVLDVKRHRNKLRPGHVRGNRFSILLRHANDLPAARTILDQIAACGLPNVYGEQRFGRDFANIDRAVDAIRRGRRGRKVAFLISSFQSALFNIWLTRRIRRGDFRCLLPGDIAKKLDTGGLFVVEDAATDTARLEAGELVYTGPMFGHKMMAATDEAGDYEQEVLAESGMTPEDFRPFRAPGTRRPALIYPEDMQVEKEDNGLRFQFYLQTGAYATVLLREVMKVSSQ